MRLIINATNLQSGGALQVASGLLKEWDIAFPEHEYHVFLSPQLQVLLQLQDFSSRFLFYSFDHNPGSSVWRALTVRRKLSGLEQQIRPQIVFTIFGPALWRPATSHICGFANGYYLFDRSAYIRDHVRTNLLLRIWYYSRRFLLLRQLYREADLLWVETDMARQQLLQEWPQVSPPIAVIGNTYNSELQRRDGQMTHDPYRFLCLAAYYPHKNLGILAGAARILKKRNRLCRIVVTLPDETYERLFADQELAGYFENKGPVFGPGLSDLYAGVDAIVFPSLLETFSAVYPEALYMGKPVLTADLNFAKRICGDAALYFDPLNAGSIADLMCRLMDDEALYLEQQQRGYEQLKTMETPLSRAAKLMALMAGAVNNKAEFLCAE